jgi:signal transduction histidine kinase
MRFRVDSILFRVMATTTALVLLASIAMAVLAATLFKDASENNFNRVLSAHLYNLIGSVGLGLGGRLQGSPQLGDIRFTIPKSGWYWAIEPVNRIQGDPIRSNSMDAAVEVPSPQAVKFNDEFQRQYVARGLDGEMVRVAETEIVLGDNEQVARFRVMGNESEFDADVRRFRDRIFVYLGVFGVVMVGVSAIAMMIGLRPLVRVRQSIEAIRAGDSDHLQGPFPAEIAPLSEEVNALIDNNRRIVERYRTQVGNLAHSLKTPLAVIANESKAIGGKRGELVAGQASRMQEQVQHYLQRARTAAQRGTASFRTPIRPVLERLVRVIAKLNRHLHVSVEGSGLDAVFAGEEGDLEEILGNLLENAGKWAKSTVRMEATEASDGNRPVLRLAVEDDGPGIRAEHRADALKRGVRLDETKQGTGLGLSIVASIVDEYGGKIRLHDAAQGGLGVEILLPAVKVGHG